MPNELRPCRDRLIEIIYDSGRDYDNYVDSQHELGMPAHEDFESWLADDLLANGVVALDTSIISPKNRPLITHFGGMPMDEVLDLVRAKQEGRLIVLPCKAGDTVYKIGTYPWSSECGECEHFMPGGFGDSCECLKTDDGRKAPECRTIVEYKTELRDILNAIGWGEFGKTLFLTKEEAEAKLKEREGNG